MFTQPRPGYNNAGGALNPCLLLLMAPLVWFQRRVRRAQLIAENQP